MTVFVELRKWLDFPNYKETWRQQKNVKWNNGKSRKKLIQENNALGSEGGDVVMSQLCLKFYANMKERD